MSFSRFPNKPYKFKVYSKNLKPTAVSLSNSMWLSVLLIAKNKVSSVHVVNFLARFGIAMQVFMVQRKLVCSFAGAFTLQDLVHPSKSFLQFLGFLSFFGKYKSRFFQPLGLCFGPLMLSMSKGLALLKNCSQPNGLKVHMFRLLNPVRLFCLLFSLIFRLHIRSYFLLRRAKSPSAFPLCAASLLLFEDRDDLCLPEVIYDFAKKDTVFFPHHYY